MPPVTTAEHSSGGLAAMPGHDDLTSPSDTTAAVGDGSTPLLELAVQYPSTGVCVATVGGELDMFTAPLLDTCVRQQLAATPTHLVLDLQPVRFFSLKGLNCLLAARELAQQTPGTQLHLAGLATRVVARPLEITGLLELFDAYPVLADALSALAAVDASSCSHR